ncbi:MAG: hypothetical protein KJO38_03120, partial [Gammaproteobacteria bacterium]|nr:hypothetical protein [Gammaproteobacteria bacterium]
MAGADIDWSRYPALAASRALSQRLIAALGDEFGRLAGPDAPVFIAAAGSLGRLEAHAASDCDLLVAGEGPLGTDIRAHIDATVAAEGLRAAKADGIYTETLRRTELLDPARRGSLAEPAGDFGRRMALLLDAAAISNDPVFRRWQRDVLEWYTA